MRQDELTFPLISIFIFISYKHMFTFTDPNHRSVRAATPGNSFPSRSSRDAPPPVEIKVIFPARPQLFNRGHRIPASNDGFRVGCRQGFG